MNEEDGFQPGPSSVTFRSWRGHCRSIGRVNRKEHTVGFKVFLLLIISAAWAVSIEFPSLGLRHPNYHSSVSMSVEDLEGHSAVALVAEKTARILGAPPRGLSEFSALGESMARSGQGLGEINPFANHLPFDAKFPSFAPSHPATAPARPQHQDSASHPTPSPTLSEFYLKKPHE